MIAEVLAEIKPSKKEEREFLDKIKSVVSKIKINGAKAELGGSGAKGTWLKGSHDADIFVKFNFARFKDKNISKILENELRKKFRIAVLHGSRDYFQIKQKDFTFEIIPILEIRNAGEAMNITDISPLHADWVNRFEELKDDIRLSKAFCKACLCYGAESYIRGFSGYSLEILTIYYEGFEEFVKAAAKWKAVEVIDPEELLSNPINELNVSKVQSPLILVDPVDKTRNVCAALNSEKFEKFKEGCRNFLKKSGKEFFVVKEQEIPKKAVVLKFKALTGKEDVVGAKILKAFEFIKMKLAKEGYKIKNSGWDFGKFWFLATEENLGKFKILKGPPAKMKNAVAEFRKKHKKIYFKKGRAYAKIGRKFADIRGFLRQLIKEKEVCRRVNKISM